VFGSEKKSQPAALLFPTNNPRSCLAKHHLVNRWSTSFSSYLHSRQVSLQVQPQSWNLLVARIFLEQAASRWHAGICWNSSILHQIYLRPDVPIIAKSHKLPLLFGRKQGWALPFWSSIAWGLSGHACLWQQNFFVWEKIMPWLLSHE
jgi:hypothetical protein